MQDRSQRCSRRKFLAQAAALTVTGGLASSVSANLGPQPGERSPLAALCTVYRPLSEAYHLLGRFWHGYPRDGQLHMPAQRLHSVYLDQRPDNDLSRDLERQAGVRVTRSVSDTLLDSSGKLAVAGVLLVAEHGNYPRNDNGQVLYPRYELLEQVVQVFRQTGQSVPVYLARHLSYSWARACRMVEWARELNFPLLTGSSLPFAQRQPELDLPAESPIEEMVVAGYGPTEIHGLLGLEALQALAERRTGGESGVQAITCLTGQDVWHAGDTGRWSWPLLQASLAHSETANLGDLRRNVGRLAVGSMPALPATAFLIDYRDGCRGTVLLLNGHVQDFTCAARLRGQTAAPGCRFHLPGAPGAHHYNPLAAAIEAMVQQRTSPQPLERALWLAGALEAAMTSHRLRGQRIETPHLQLPYRTT